MNKQILETLSWRYATKVFDSSKKLTEEQTKVILEAIRMAPTSFGLQNFRVVVVKDTETRAKLKEVAYGQSQVSDSSMFLVFCVQKEIGEKHIENHIKLHSETKGVEISSLDGYKQMLLGYINNKPAEALTSWATRQAYIALGFGLFAAAEIGVDSCPMEGFDTTSLTRFCHFMIKD